MKKEFMKKNGKKHYLLGINNEGEEIWLQEANWECGWYWGLGYIEIFDERNILTYHTHFDCLFFNKPIPDSFNSYFKETPFTEREKWDLLEIMKSLYTLRKYSDLLHLGGANITSAKYKELISNNEEYKRINETVIPELLKKLYSILSKQD